MTTPSSPKRITWIIGIVCGLLGILGHYTHVEIISEHSYLLLLIGFIVLALGTSFREL